MYPTPEDLEFAIKREYLLLIYSNNQLQREYHAKQMCDLVKQRSPEKVAEMEKELGLRGLGNA